MTRPYRQQTAHVEYRGWFDEGVILARTTQKYQGVSTLGLSRGKVQMRSMYGIKPTPFADDLMLSLYQLHIVERLDLTDASANKHT